MASCDLCEIGHDEQGIVWVQPLSLTPDYREKLEERLQIDALSQQMLDQCVLGQNIAETSPPRIATHLIVRDYPEIANFDGTQSIGVVMVPEGYIPKKAKVVNPDITDDEIRQLPLPFGKTKGEVTGANSDLRERQVYECLRTHFSHKNEQ